MYIAGRFLTASRPSRMLIEDASYAPLFFGVIVLPGVANMSTSRLEEPSFNSFIFIASNFRQRSRTVFLGQSTQSRRTQFHKHSPGKKTFRRDCSWMS